MILLTIFAQIEYRQKLIEYKSKGNLHKELSFYQKSKANI